MKYRIAVDTGGTFTDVVVADEKGFLTVGKSLTTLDRYYNGFKAALDNAASSLNTSGEHLIDNCEVLIYGTTRSTNAIVENKVAKTALLVTEGFPDILTYRHGGKQGVFDLAVELPDPYIPRRLTFEVPERINAEGEIELELNTNKTEEIINDLKKMDIEAVAVSLLWSISNPVHEVKVGELLKKLTPDLPFTLSHKLNPIIREFPRTSSTAMDASLKPLMQQHLRDLEEDLRGSNYKGEILISVCSGGVMHVQDVIEKPIYTVKSGPAMAPVASIAYSSADNLGDDIIVVDTGGTTFDVSLIREGQIKYSRDTWLLGEWTGHLLGLSSVDIRSVGAGGGSIAWIDSGGLLRVGPQSSGANPGPACYNQGGAEPTVTDAAVMLGYIDPEHFLGSRMKLNQEAAKKAIEKIAKPLSLSLEETADAIITLAGENMIKSIHEITVQDGVNPAECILVAGGGAAGLNIVPIAKSLGCKKILIPRTAGALSACGGQYSNVVAEFSGSYYSHTEDFDYEGVDKTLNDIKSRLTEFKNYLQSKNINEFDEEYFLSSRYLNQQWDMEIPLPVNEIKNEHQLQIVSKAFHDTHFQRYAVKEEDSIIECIDWKGRLSAILEKPTIPKISVSDKKIEKNRESEAYFNATGKVTTPVYLGERLLPGMVIKGPAIIEEPTTTVVIYPNSKAEITETRNYLIHV